MWFYVSGILCMCKIKGNVPQAIFSIVVGSEKSQYIAPKKCNENDFKASISRHERWEQKEIGNIGTQLNL